MRLNNLGRFDIRVVTTAIWVYSACSFLLGFTVGGAVAVYYILNP